MLSKVVAHPGMAITRSAQPLFAQRRHQARIYFESAFIISGMVENAFDSPCPHILGTNYKPTTTESATIHRFLEAPKAELSSIQEKLAKLQARSDQLELLIDQHRALTSPMRRMPNDILREIFVRCLPIDALPARDLLEAPLLLTTICRLWREVAITTPTLWNSIDIQLPTVLRHELLDDTFEGLVERRFEGTRLWLERSGSLPLSIFFTANLECSCLPSFSMTVEWQQANPIIAESMKRFMQLFLRFYPRWKRVTFNVPAPILRCGDTDILSSHPPRLESLELCRSFRELVPHDNLVPHILRAPTLRSLHYNRDAVDLPTRFHHLTDLRISSPWSRSPMNHVQVIEVLLRCSHSLRACALDMIVLRRPQVQNGLTIQLPRLEHLTIRFCRLARAENTSLFLQSLLTPKLRELAFHILEPQMPGQLYSEALSSFPQFLERSQCYTSLTSLSLFIRIDGDTVISWLRLLPALTTLKIVGDVLPLRSTYAYDRGQGLDPESVLTVTRRLLEALTYEVLCPDLEHVEFKDCDPRLADAFFAFAETRGRTLRKYYVDCWRPLALPEEELGRRLGALREKGMDVVWRSRPAPKFVGQAKQDGPRDGLKDVHGEEFLFPYLEDRSWFNISY
ncbi:hypothetical protein V5O48_013245 [Marasmius crinis-equi]|uniref:F-box domain-containing protein n=1 Tax=Marasmius crinis-equi TaxID=585013 RepID=A0ABR3F0L0_9AGAR